MTLVPVPYLNVEKGSETIYQQNQKDIVFLIGILVFSNNHVRMCKETYDLSEFEEHEPEVGAFDLI